MNRNVALVVLDSVRKDFFDAHATRIRELADVSFEQTRAPSSWSVPSHASMFAGTLPSEHGVHTYNRSFDDVPPEALFHTQLPHNTVGVSANTFAGSAYGFDASFDTFVDVSPHYRHPEGVDPSTFESGDNLLANRYLRFAREALRQPHTLASVQNGIKAFLHQLWRELPAPKLVDDSGKAVRRNARTTVAQTAEPWFLFVNFMDAHMPLQHFVGLQRASHDAETSWCSDRRGVWELMGDDHPDYWRIRESLYGAYVEYLDRVVAAFVEQLQQATAQPTTVIVTADHGENHGEASADRMANHKSSLSEQLLHVPFEVINPPDGASAPDGLSTLLDLPDLATAIANDEWCDCSRETVPAELLGMSAGPEPPADRDRAFYTRAIRAAYRDDTKFVWDSLGKHDEYRIDPATPSDQTHVETDVALPAWATDLFSTRLDEAVGDARATASTNAVSSAVESRLEELGYK